MHPSTDRPQVDNDDLLRLGRRGQLTANITWLMLKGAGYAAILVFGLWLGIALLNLLGNWLLPEDRLFTPDPTPWSVMIEAEALETLA